MMVGRHADQASVDAAVVRLGLDRPIHEQLGLYIQGIFKGDLGTSWRTGRTVLSDMGTRWPATIELATVAFIVTALWSVPLGILAGIKPNSIWDRIAKFLSGLGVSVPEFWLGLMLILVFFIGLGWAPAPLGRLPDGVQPPSRVTGLYTVDAVLTSNWTALRAALFSLALPVVTLAVATGAPLLRVTRTFMQQTMQSPFVLAARACGVSQRSIALRHALRNVLLPVTTMMGMLYGYLLGGTVLVEVIFSWPGIGKYAVDSILASDFAPVMATALLGAVTYLLAYVVIDIFHFVIDPRVRTL